MDRATKHGLPEFDMFTRHPRRRSRPQMTRPSPTHRGAGRSSVVRAFARGAMGCRIDPSWGGERDVAPW